MGRFPPAALQTIFNRKKIDHKKILGSEKVYTDIKTINKFTENLDFKLTNAQKRTIEEILDDMNKNSPMKRDSRKTRRWC